MDDKISINVCMYDYMMLLIVVADSWWWLMMFICEIYSNILGRTFAQMIWILCLPFCRAACYICRLLEVSQSAMFKD